MIHAAGQRRSSDDPVHAMYRRVLAGWAMDALSLRRRGLDRPSSRDGLAPVGPGREDPAARRGDAAPGIGLHLEVGVARF